MVSSCLFSFLNRCLASISSGASRRRRGRGRRPSHRVLVRPACCRGLRPSSWCSTFPGSVLLRGVAHLRYACVVCAHTSASGCSPTRGIPGGMSTGSSAVLPGTAPIELVLDVPGERAPSGCSAPALRLRCRCAYVGERVLANPGCPREGRAPARPLCCRGAAPIELVLDVPGERAPSGCSAPALRLRCRCAYVDERVLANPLYSREGRAPARPVGLGRGFTRGSGLHQEVASTSTTRASGAWFLTDSMPLSREAAV